MIRADELAAAPPACAADAEHHCITCSDEGTPMIVLEVDGTRGLALCGDLCGAHHTVEVALVEAAEGDTLLVHAGTALLNLNGARS
jgi:hydrogenase maturation factor